MTTLFFFLLGCSLHWTDGTSTSLNAHRPYNITWIIKDAYGQVLNSTHNYAKIDTYFPHFDFAEMIVGKTAYTKTGFETPQPSPSIVKKLHLYICPGHDTSPDHQYTCGGLSDYFCKSWSCVSTGHIWWSPPYKNDLITLSCSKGDRSSSTLWDTGVKWGGRVYDTVGYDSGNIFYIQRQAHIPSSDPVGPSAKEIKSSFLQPLPTTTNPLLPLLRSSYSVLNASNTFISKHCWLCLSPTPPFYEAVGSSQAIRNDTSDSQCRWHDRGWTQVFTTFGGNISKRLQGQYFIPGDALVWACSTGLTACASGDTLIKQNSFCIQVQLLPKMDVYNSEDFVSLLEPRQYNLRAKREVVTALTLAVLLGLGASGTATGIAGLVTSDQHFRHLSATIDADLRRIEQSIVALQNSLTSLSEVVLQNRRGLDLLFLKQGGLCAALKEECCFYADSSGVVLDSMKELDTRLKERQREREAQHTWYQGLFNFSPWLTTLVSAIAGPLILLLVLCTIGPCILGKVLAFLKCRLSQLDSNLSRTQKQVNTLISHTQEKQPLLSFSSDSDKDEIIKMLTVWKNTGWRNESYMGDKVTVRG
uniref:Envelope protein n=1 Tax=Pseudonaja textilis TaxID=8673 RepID=A0A670ZL67_PSETE